MAQAPTLEDAIALAAQAHRGQVDKGGEIYLFHPLRLAMRLQGEPERMAAVLHDVVEDTELSLQQLRDLGYPPTVVDAVDALTRREHESYEAFILRAGAHPVARVVKVADIEDNLDLSRIAAPGPRDEERMVRYRAALELLRTGS